MRNVKKVLLVLVLAMMFTGTISSTVTYAKSINYQKRVKKAKKNLAKRVKKELSWAYKPSVRIVKSKRKGRYLTCTLQGSIGDGACDGKVRVDLKTGVVTVLDSMDMFMDFEDEGAYSFIIKVK